jgi:hypothetical protein
VLKLLGKILLTPKSSEICPFFKFFLVRRKLPFFGQNCSLHFSLRSLDIPDLLKSWQNKHYKSWQVRLRQPEDDDGNDKAKERMQNVKQACLHWVIRIITLISFLLPFTMFTPHLHSVIKERP